MNTRRPASRILQSSAARPSVGCRKHHSYSRPAFTLLELLISLAIIGFLLALLAPALRPARAKADLTKQLSIQHQLLAAISMYTSDAGGYYPYFATPGNPNGPIRVRNFDLAQQGKPYFRAQSAYWPSIVAPRYLSSTADLEDDMFEDTRRQMQWPDYVIATQYWMSHAFHAAPEYWRGVQPPENLSWLTGTRIEKVRFPSSKTLLLQMTAANGPQPGPDPAVQYIDTTVGLVDGSARIVLFPPENYQDRTVSRPFGALAWPSLSTRDGIQGRDY